MPVLHDNQCSLDLELVRREDDSLCLYGLLPDLLGSKVRLSGMRSNLKCRRLKVCPDYMLYPQYYKEYPDMERSSLLAQIYKPSVVYRDCLLQRLFSSGLVQRTDTLEI